MIMGTQQWPDSDPPNLYATEKQKTEEELRREKLLRVGKHTHTATSIKTLPSDIRYWALTQESMRYDSGYGTERGYDCTMEYLSVTWFDDEEALEAWVLRAVEDKKAYKVFRAEPVSTEVKAVFSIKN
jgi:hypothetical protein